MGNNIVQMRTRPTVPVILAGVAAFLDLYSTQPLLPLLTRTFGASTFEAGLHDGDDSGRLHGTRGLRLRRRGRQLAGGLRRARHSYRRRRGGADDVAATRAVEARTSRRESQRRIDWTFVSQSAPDRDLRR